MLEMKYMGLEELNKKKTIEVVYGKFISRGGPEVMVPR